MLKKLIRELLSYDTKLTVDILKESKRIFSRENKLQDIPSNTTLLSVYRQGIKDGERTIQDNFTKILQKRGIRSQSGIVAVQVLTKPFRCPGKCIFCPNDPTMPKSYIKTEPGAMRAYLNQFDPIKQVYNRLRSLRATGHNTEKIELIVLGGTRDVYPESYKNEFITKLYYACNTFNTYRELLENHNKNNKTTKDFKDTFTAFDKNPEQVSKKLDIDAMFTTGEGYSLLHGSGDTFYEIQKNEKADNRIIGLTVETRPEYITDQNCRTWRLLGVTRLEIGIQSTNNEVLDANKRDNTVEQYRAGLHKLRQYGFKFSIHIMPGLYKSTYQRDLQTFIDIYTDKNLLPDEIKFYPTSVIPNTELYDLYKSGLYTPLTTKYIQDLVAETFATIIPPYTRIKRLIRDIPATEIEAGSNITNLAQLTHQSLLRIYKKDKQTRNNVYGRLYTHDHSDLTTKIKTDCYPWSTIQGQSIASLSQIIQGGGNINISILGSSDIIRDFVSLDTRSREIRHKPKNIDKASKEYGDKTFLVIRQYTSSVGKDFFISCEDGLGYLYGFTRLTLPDQGQAIQWDGLGDTTALIRELHVYGKLESLSKKKSDTAIQHQGIGSTMLQVGESIASIHGYKNLSVISGVGVRAYYQKKGFVLSGTYMVKEI